MICSSKELTQYLTMGYGVEYGNGQYVSGGEEVLAGVVFELEEKGLLVRTHGRNGPKGFLYWLRYTGSFDLEFLS